MWKRIIRFIRPPRESLFYKIRYFFDHLNLGCPWTPHEYTIMQLYGILPFIPSPEVKIIRFNFDSVVSNELKNKIKQICK